MTIYGSAFNLLSKLLHDQIDLYYQMQQVTWLLIDDSMYTPLCLLYSGDVLARGLVQLALGLAGQQVEDKVEDIWEDNQEIKEAAMKDIQEFMISLYSFRDADKTEAEIATENGVP